LRNVLGPTRSIDLGRSHRVTDCCGAILAGGQSTRFGEDKFLFLYEGRAMGLRAMDALVGVCGDRLWLQGGRSEYAQLTGLALRSGTHEGAGPLGAVVDALLACTQNILVTLPCDVPMVTAREVAVLVNSLEDGDDMVVACVDDGASALRRHWLVAAWNVSCTAALLERFEEGERAVHRAVESLRIREIEFASNILVNVNRSPE
jgi:molybdopterin-guanine dinucleotide biosynthesis protein A